MKNDFQHRNPSPTSHESKTEPSLAIEDCKANGCHTAIAFSIPVKKSPQKRTPPSRLRGKVDQRREVTMAALQEKQRLADERRKKREEERLDRIHKRQEAARKLAQNVDIILQQRAFAQGNNATNIQPMTQQDLYSTAKQIKHDFFMLKCQLRKDLTVENEKKASHNETSHNKNIDENQNCKQGIKKRHDSGSVSISFEVKLDDVECKNKCAPPPNLTSARKLKKEQVDHFNLEEKQRKAEERRDRRMRDRVRRARENRESLMTMAMKMEKLMKHEAAVSGYDDEGQKLAKEEVVMLAHEIADGFDRIGQRYDADLQRARNFFVPQPLGIPKK
ncbi:leucine-rich repeat and IQ domain-containing protein 1 isoform X2 [Nematostella vectensis]|uniref:leucine-rich repeat and IQ domain-containing protein 1 isoform X2 n=1 Tax=Nematostella vectensis TaxID=45351 RepID=UPI0013903888|nr:leucine-rich repeat and IQ domain-containing protein 1 isoform X2 [Nematostella vectensis]